jgi:hypothetical protein
VLSGRLWNRDGERSGGEVAATSASTSGGIWASTRFLVWKEGKRSRVSSLAFQRGRGEVWSAVEWDGREPRDLSASMQCTVGMVHGVDGGIPRGWLGGGAVLQKTKVRERCLLVRPERGGAVRPGDVVTADRWCRAAGVSREKGTKRGAGLRQRVTGLGARLQARAQGRRWSVSAKGGRREDAHHVFDALSALRARSSTAERKQTKSRAWLGRIKGGQGRLLARWYGQDHSIKIETCHEHARQEERGKGLGQ